MFAFQYKDAFMKANPDYKWHNPEKSLNSTKSSPDSGKALKSDINILSEGSITPGKLAGKDLKLFFTSQMVIVNYFP